MSIFLAVKVSLRVTGEEITKQKDFLFFIFTQFIYKSFPTGGHDMKGNN